MFGQYFYHASIRKFVAVFGTMFNNIKIKNSNGKGLMKVSLAYGPKAKFLQRLDDRRGNLDKPEVKMRLPRIAFEIGPLSPSPIDNPGRYDSIRTDGTTASTKTVYNSPVFYRIGATVSIMTKRQDDMYQIIEQILPYFQPEFTVGVTVDEDSNIRYKTPITLTGIDMQDDYEGSFTESRVLITTLTFEARIRFYGPPVSKNVIKTVTTNYFDYDTRNRLIEKYRASVDPSTATENDEYDIVEEFIFAPDIDNITLTYTSYGDNTPFDVGETVQGNIHGATGVIESLDTTNKIVRLSSVIGVFDIGEIVVGNTSGAAWQISKITFE